MLRSRTTGPRGTATDRTGPGPEAALDPDRVPVTRIEVLDFVGELFDGCPVPRAVLLESAREAGARGALLDLLDARLPEGPLLRVGDLWRYLDVPEDLTAAGF